MDPNHTDDLLKCVFLLQFYAYFRVYAYDDLPLLAAHQQPFGEAK